MKRKFLKLIEQITDKMNSSFQPGGLVKLASDYKSKDGYKEQNSQQKKYIDGYFDTDSNYIITNVVNKYPSRQPGNDDNRQNFFYITVAREIAPGLHDEKGQVTLTSDMLDTIDLGINRHPEDKNTRGDNKVQIDPREVGEEDEIEITRMTQQGDSLKKTNLTNATKNTKIPSSPATPSPAVKENYTVNYMPING
jgi:hypothetical protein